MNRREVLAGTIAAALSACDRRSGAANIDAAPSVNNFLHPTTYIDTGHPAITDVVGRVTRADADARTNAIALFAFVRALPFGFATGFWDNKASDVLRAGRGYCNTKSTLFIALLRAAAIPARQQFVDIDAAILHGILDPGTAMVDHSYVEVLIESDWVATDAYIVDPRLFASARRRLAAERRLLGYSAHATGSNDWDGISPSFSQYNFIDPRPIGVKRWGIFEDVGDFYARVGDAHNRLNAVLRAGVGLIAAPANRRAEALRVMVAPAK